SNAESVSLSVNNAQHNKKSQLLLALVGKETSESKEIAHLLKKALEFKGQCFVDLVHTPSFIKKKEALAYKQKGYDYIIFIEPHADHFDWHLFDIAQEDTIKSKKISRRSVNRATAYAMADSLNEVLTGEPGFFSTKIAYTQEVPLKSGKHYS